MSCPRVLSFALSFPSSLSCGCYSSTPLILHTFFRSLLFGLAFIPFGLSVGFLFLRFLACRARICPSRFTLLPVLPHERPSFVELNQAASGFSVSVCTPFVLPTLFAACFLLCSPIGCTPSFLCSATTRFLTRSKCIFKAFRIRAPLVSGSTVFILLNSS